MPQPEPYTIILEDSDADAGIHRSDFARAVSAWAWMQQRDVSVAEAATTFNTTPAIIRQAVEDHYWMFLVGNPSDPTQQFIEHDGE